MKTILSFIAIGLLAVCLGCQPQDSTDDAGGTDTSTGTTDSNTTYVTPDSDVQLS